MEDSFRDYLSLATRNEDLKSQERVISTAIENIQEIKILLVEKETQFCSIDRDLRSYDGSNISVKESLQKRCTNYIDHLVHYKCIIECLSGDFLTLESNLISDDEYLSLSLTFRDAELAILKAIKVNQHRNEFFCEISDIDAESYLSEVNQKWHSEHPERRELISKLILDLNQFMVDKATSNLEQQQILLNHRYQSINNLIKKSYNHMNDGSSIEINKNHA